MDESFRFKLPKRVFRRYWEYVLYKTNLRTIDEKEYYGRISHLLRTNFSFSHYVKVERFSCDLPRVGGFAGISESQKPISFGLDRKNPNNSISKMIGEFLERQVLTGNWEVNIRLKLSLKELRNLYNVKFPHDYNKFTDIQRSKLPSTQIDENVELECVRVDELISGKKVFYPRQVVFFKSKNEDCKFQMYPRNSNGAAGWFNLIGATNRALLELIERDAFLCHWLTKTTPKEIIIDDEEILNSLKDLNKYGIKVRIFNITTENQIPTVLALLEDCYSPKKKIFICLGSNFTFKDAIRGMINEMFQLSYLLNEEWRFIDVELKSPFTDRSINLEMRHMLLYGSNCREVDFLIGGEMQNLSNLENKDVPTTDESKLNYLKKMINCDEIYRYVSNSPALNEIGFTVVKIIIPKLIPFHLDEVDAMPLSERLNIFLSKSGKSTEFTLNPFPHPFP